ncbi:Alpha-amylase A type-3 [Sparassis crispa]|uniref:alpha-amylase n=1 Tax=Sparassis crispa TaxID=139825 RepID=A0A401GYB8_9APHY|nr:Alpha-amylase A type-3 [Sparassis crispa]GBE87192.1 Alpha-amylase A type-3 [Sparassis crispa]
MLPSLVPLFLFVLPVISASAEDWRSRSIYQLVTDRFATTNGSSPPCDTSNRKYCGGTWQGVINKLPYIQNMGFDAVWISPIVANVEGFTAYGEAFHGYWTQNIDAINYHFGSEDDLKALSSALHQSNMYLMVDVVVNHMAATTNPPDYSTFQPFDIQSDFHSECFISNYSNQTNVEQCWLGDTNLPLADLDTEDDTIVNSMYSWIKTVVGNFTADGIRIDTVKHIRKDFWPQFAQSAEVIDSVLDYPAWFPLTSGFQSTSGNLSALAETVQAAQGSYKDGQFVTGSFLENHDQPRFQSLTQDQALVKNAMTWPFVQDGIPILYYGQEQGYTGGADPANREALWLSGYVEDNKPLLTHVKTLNAVRKMAAAANSSFLTTAAKFSSTTSTLAVSKPPLLTLLTNGGNSSTPTWTVSDTGFKPNEQLVEVLSCSLLSADKKGGVSVHGSGGMPQVIMPRSALNQSGSVCPSLATSSGSQASSAADLTLPLAATLVLGILSAIFAA